MQELTMNEVEEVGGGDFATAGAYAGGLGTSMAIGSSLGPIGVAVAALTFTASFAITYAVMGGYQDGRGVARALQ